LSLQGLRHDMPEVGFVFDEQNRWLNSHVRCEQPDWEIPHALVRGIPPRDEDIRFGEDERSSFS
jgi:hypothetical protein